MADPKRLQLLKRYTQLLQTISVANGYYSDVGGLVFRGRWEFGSDEPLPVISILQNPKQSEELHSGTRSYAELQLSLYVQGFVDDDVENPSDPAELLLADLVKATARIGAVEDPFYLLTGDIITGLSSEPLMGVGVVLPPNEVVSKTFCMLPVNFSYVEDFSSP